MVLILRVFDSVLGDFIIRRWLGYGRFLVNFGNFVVGG